VVLKSFFKKISLFFVLCFFLLSGGGIAYAQVLGPGGGLSFTISPKFPKSNQEVRVKLESSLYDLSRSLISWRLNGTSSSQGVGLQSFSFTTGRLGIQSVVRATITTPEGFSVEKEFSITPADVDLVWETHSYTPPFYKGKSLASREASVKIVALPNIIHSGVLVPNSNILYSWRVDNKSVPNRSGIGKNVFTTQIPLVSNSLWVSVTASTIDGLVVTESSVYVNAVRPEAFVYEYDPLLGFVFEKNITDITLPENDEVVVEVFPFFFPTVSRLGQGLSYEWRLGNLKESIGSSRLVLSEEFLEGRFGGVSIRVSDRFNILKSAEASFRVLSTDNSQ